MIIDTNIIIAYLAGESVVIHTFSKLFNDGTIFYLPTIVETELLAYSIWTSEQASHVQHFLQDLFVSVSFDRNLVRIAAEVRRQSNLKLPDAVVAACALALELPLWTRNIKDFRKVQGLQLVSL